MVTEAMSGKVDQILVSVIGNRLDAISKEIGQMMLRTSRSTIFSEARDFVTAIFDRELRLVAQTAYIPVIMGCLPYAIQAIAEHFKGNIHEGDVFILNDPYRGNNHQSSSGRSPRGITRTSVVGASPATTPARAACGKSASASRHPSSRCRGCPTRPCGT
jgi:hypothetical protein